MTTRERGGLLRSRDFRLLWTGETTSVLGSSIAVVALPLVAVVTVGASTFAVGLLTAAAWLPWLLIGLPAGAWVDRRPKRPVMLVCNGISMLVFLSVPVAAWAGLLTMTQLIVVAFAGGVAKVFFNVAYRAYLPSLIDKDQLQEANEKLQGSESAAQIGGPGLAGLLAHWFGAVAGVFADAVSFGISVLCLRSIRHREPERPAKTRSRLRDDIRDGLVFVVHDPYLRVLAVFGAISNVALMGYQSIEVVFLVRDLGVGEGTAGLVLALVGAGGVFGAALSGKLAARIGTARAFVLCEAFGALMMLLGPLANGGWGLAFFVAAGFSVSAGVVGSNVLNATFRQRYVPAAMFGRVTASSSVLSFGAVALGGLLGGILGETAGVRQTLGLMAGLEVVAVFVLLFTPVGRCRDFPTDRV
ncbi:MFS transporter [Amycolatopsis keratiniphila]|uniref:MFS transporter n=1 Tax=Amycolatopsis keratiniphila subsp. keratiniphila TaxID=227715 RepID=A0A1W2LGQ2_9PSEU|nr:MFS transporter [Amycolatopsis keratiniphila]ONF62047.1 MFS transporter [Amycolatopsis keratiniphila subsp. keratiniphila]